MCINYNWLQKIYYIISIYKSYLICWRQTGKSILIFKESIKISCYILAIWIVCSDYHPDHHENCRLNVKNCQKLEKKMCNCQKFSFYSKTIAIGSFFFKWTFLAIFLKKKWTFLAFFFLQEGQVPACLRNNQRQMSLVKKVPPSYFKKKQLLFPCRIFFHGLLTFICTKLSFFSGSLRLLFYSKSRKKKLI